MRSWQMTWRSSSRRPAWRCAAASTSCAASRRALFMDFRLSPDEEQFRTELHVLLSRLVTPAVLEETDSGQELGPRVRGVLRELGHRGWLAPGWPKRFGGVDGTPVQTALVEDA